MLFNQEFISPYLVFQGLLNFPQQLQERTIVFQFHPSKWKLFDTGQLSIQFQILKRKKKPIEMHRNEVIKCRKG